MFLRFRRDTPASRGQALVETALVLPILALILVMAVDFGRVFFGWVALQSAARVGAEYAGQFSCAWEGTCPENADKVDRYEDLIEADMRAINCELAGGTVPDPTFRNRVGTETAGEFDDGDYAIVELECSFDLITPIAEAMFGGTVETIAHEEFPIHATILQAVPSPPELPPPCPAGEAEVPDMVPQTMGIARDMWVAKGFDEANFDPPPFGNGVISTGPPSGRNVDKITSGQSLLKNECAVLATAEVDMDFIP